MVLRPGFLADQCIEQRETNSLVLSRGAANALSRMIVLRRDNLRTLGCAARPNLKLSGALPDRLLTHATPARSRRRQIVSGHSLSAPRRSRRRYPDLLAAIQGDPITESGAWRAATLTGGVPRPILLWIMPMVPSEAVPRMTMDVCARPGTDPTHASFSSGWISGACGRWG